MAIAAKLAAESGKPVPVKVYLAQRPDEPLIFSIYHHNTANELVQLAARTLDVSPADFILRQVGPGTCCCCVVSIFVAIGSLSICVVVI